ncbi:RNA dependent RNA polymerase-domain-containing protein [Aspergillus karnatakaensis]|uniref:RNA dependent RNA polymerase n=1 Tax=Aspergillus karnatakaensis TaxID=1810916 RepID=UPI003CCD7882
MEVFLRNLPPDLTSDALKKQLATFMKPLGVKDWDCEKPKKRGYGHLVFLHGADRDRFLASYGEIPQPGNRRSKPNMKILGFDVFCAMSSREPHEYTVKALQHAAHERQHPSRVVEDEGHSVSFALHRLSCGYTTFSEDEFVYVPELLVTSSGSVTFKRRNIIVRIEGLRMIRIPLNTVVEVVWASSGSLLVTLTTVPLFFRCDSDSTYTRLCSLGHNHSDVVGTCLVYQFQVDQVQLKHKMEQLGETDLTITFYQFKTMHLETWQSQSKAMMEELAIYTRDQILPFAFLLQLQSLVTNAYLPPSTVRDLTKKLAAIFKARKSAGRRPLSVNFIKQLSYLINWPSPFSDPHEFTVAGLLEMITATDQDLQDGIIQADSLSRPNSNLALIHRVTVTPSRITLHGPEVEPLNRILRRFPNHHEYFVRVQFCDENGQDLRFSPKINNDEVFARFKSIFMNGIQIAGRHFTFLGFSHSSLRSHSAWFSAPFVDDNDGLQTYFSIIKAIGSFSSITSPARCAARIGQAFSDTPFALNLDDHGISVSLIPDVEFNGRVYSDGVGTISQGAVNAIQDILPPRKGHPTCFQIRLGGAKGMLSLDCRLSGLRICTRPSMVKFEAEDQDNVEICGSASKPIGLVLNRQVIKILEDMGVPDSWFMDLQALRIEQLRVATATTKHTARFLKGQDVGECIRLYRLFLLFDRLELNYKEVPFLRSIVEAMVLRELRLLKHKARIPVAKGITLYGVMDETGFLNEDEVFVTYSTMDGRFAAPPGACRMLVTRSPALHDGDIQYAYNVLPPKEHPLTKLKNCIVFSRKGSRDLPSQLSGGDLDGDLYNIIWDPEATPSRVFAPADYPRVPPLDIRRPVTREDMANFFVDFMQADKLGVIATKHMILADQMELGTSHSNCKMLALLHSTAVDFSKTGIPVDLSEMPYVNRYRPDFLAPGPQSYIYNKQDIKLEALYVVPAQDDDAADSAPQHQYYRSEKILGKLYRAIDEHKIWKEDIHWAIQPDPETVWASVINTLTRRCIAIGASINWKHHVETARQLRLAYETAITGTMNAFSLHPLLPITELEVFLGQILNNTGVQTHWQRERSIKLKDEFDRIASWILAQMRPPGPKSGYTGTYDALERSVACFHVAGETGHMWNAGHKRGGWQGLESFRVVAACAVLSEVEHLEKVHEYDYENGYGYQDENTGVALSVVDRPVKNGGVLREVFEQEIMDGEEGNLYNLEMLLRALGR